MRAASGALVILANARIQEATRALRLAWAPLARRVPRQEAARRGPVDHRICRYPIDTSHDRRKERVRTARRGKSPGPLTLPLPAKRRGEGMAGRGSWPEPPKCHLVGAPRRRGFQRPLSPPLCGERFGEGLGDWPHNFKQDRSRQTETVLCAYDGRFRGDDKASSLKLAPSPLTPPGKNPEERS